MASEQHNTNVVRHRDRNLFTTGTPVFCGPRIQPLEVIIVGLSRTGTTSMLEAMKILGYGDIWNSREMLRNHQIEFCGKTVRNKYTAVGRQAQVEEFESLFADYHCISGEFVGCMAEDLIRAYPDAKVILTVREDEERWHRSFLDTLWYNYSTWSHWILRRVDRQWRAQAAFLNPWYEHFWGGDPAVHGLRVYREHKAMVQRITEPKGRLLVYDVREGWGPLCKFLGKNVPTEGFPKTNNVEEHRELFGTARRKSFRAWLIRAMLTGGLPVAVTAVLLVYRSRVVSFLQPVLTKAGLRQHRT